MIDRVTIEDRPRWRSVLQLGLLGGFALAGPLVGGALVLVLVPMFTPVQPDAWFVAAVSIAGCLLVGFALVPSIVFAAYLGFATNDPVLATVCATTAIGVATGIGILLFRQISDSAAETILAFRPQWLAEFHRLQNQHHRGLLMAIFLARLSPHVPFAATNLMIAQLKMSLVRATLVSWLGLLPRSIFAVVVGSQVKEFHKIADVGSLGWDSVATLMLIGVVIVWLLRKRLNRVYTSLRTKSKTVDQSSGGVL